MADYKEIKKRIFLLGCDIEDLIDDLIILRTESKGQIKTDARYAGNKLEEASDIIFKVIERIKS